MVLLFVTMIVIGPLARHASDALNQPSRFGLSGLSRPTP